MITMALETSTLVGSVALIKDGTVISERSSVRQKTHSENLSPFIEECLHETNLALDQIDLFAVGQGPGSFTGIRVATNAGKSFAYSFQKPLVSIDSLTVLAEQARGKSPIVAAMINAHKNMVYLGIFDLSQDEPQYLFGPEAVPVRLLKDVIKQDCLVVGDGYEAFHEYFPTELSQRLRRDSTIPDHPLAKTLGILAETRGKKGLTLDWNSFTPLYIRASEAEETKKGILISPLK